MDRPAPSHRPPVALVFAGPSPPRPDPGEDAAPDPGEGALPLLVPLLAADDEITPELDRALSVVALAAREGDPAARNALYLALETKIARFVARHGRRVRAAGGPRRDGRPWAAEDLAQEGFLILTDLVAEWPGGPFGPYLLAHFPWRVRDAARRLEDSRRLEATTPTAEPALTADDSAQAAEATVLLETLAGRLPAPDGEILLRHIRDGESLSAIARHLGLGRHTVGRRWGALLTELRHSLGSPPRTAAPRRGRRPRRSDNEGGNDG